MRRIPDEAPRLEPLIHPDTEAFWAGLEEGDLQIQVCGRCGTYRFPFAPVCYRCRSFDHTWQPISLNGSVAAAVVVRRATGDPLWSAHVPFISGIVDMEHGIRLPGRILCTCEAGRQRGTAVQAVLLTSPGRATIHAFAHVCREED